MPLWSVRLQRAAFAWLLAGFGVGAVLLASKGYGWVTPRSVLLGFHVEALLVGWLLQFTMGVAFWMLPRHAAGPERGPEPAVALAFTLVNLGTMAVALGTARPAAGVISLGRLAELAAVVAFGWNAWPRVKPFGRT
jgi:hypothetical protein